MYQCDEHEDELGSGVREYTYLLATGFLCPKAQPLENTLYMS